MEPITLALTLASQFAPAVIKYLTGSDTAGKVATEVIEVAKSVTGMPTGSEALNALRANPELALQFEQSVMLHEARLEELYLADRADARKRDTAFITSGCHNYRADLLAFLAVSGLICCVWFIARDDSLSERSVNAIMFVAGVLASAVRDVFSFEFGSSRGSKEKDDQIRSLLK